jgi:hypothetical protein
LAFFKPKGRFYIMSRVNYSFIFPDTERNSSLHAIEASSWSDTSFFQHGIITETKKAYYPDKYFGRLAGSETPIT